MGRREGRRRGRGGKERGRRGRGGRRRDKKREKVKEGRRGGRRGKERGRLNEYLPTDSNEVMHLVTCNIKDSSDTTET